MVEGVTVLCKVLDSVEPVEAEVIEETVLPLVDEMAAVETLSLVAVERDDGRAVLDTVPSEVVNRDDWREVLDTPEDAAVSDVVVVTSPDETVDDELAGAVKVAEEDSSVVLVTDDTAEEVTWLWTDERLLTVEGLWELETPVTVVPVEVGPSVKELVDRGLSLVALKEVLAVGVPLELEELSAAALVDTIRPDDVVTETRLEEEELVEIGPSVEEGTLADEIKLVDEVVVVPMVQSPQP